VYGFRFSIASLTEKTSKTKAHFTLIDKHAGMTLGEIAAQEATSN